MTLKQPYIFHLDATAALLESYGEQAQVVGYLHDVIEDTSVTELEIAEKLSLSSVPTFPHQNTVSQ